jgi:hypothetical protein
MASAAVISALARRSGRVRIASYSRNKATVATAVSSRLRINRTTSAAAPVRLRNAVTMTLVSTTSHISPAICQASSRS